MNESSNKKSMKTAGAVIALLVILIVTFAVIGVKFGPQTLSGSKSLTITVNHKDGTSKEFDTKTDAEYLRGALEEINLVGGYESEYGLYIQTVDGEKADEKNQEWWCITKSGEMTMYGIDEQPIADGEEYELSFMTGF